MKKTNNANSVSSLQECQEQRTSRREIFCNNLASMLRFSYGIRAFGGAGWGEKPVFETTLAQTNWQGETLTDANWRDQVSDRLCRPDWENIQVDVRPFVESGFDLSLLSLENLEWVLGG